MAGDQSDRPIDRVIVVTRKTELEELTARFNTQGQARFYLKQAGMDFDPVKTAHDTYHQALDRVMGSLPQGLKQLRLDRELVPQFEFGSDVVIAIGQDGLVSNTAKYLPYQPLIGINPNPALFDGALLPWNAGDTETVLGLTLSGKAKRQAVVMAEARSNDGRRLIAFNDLFVGASTHVSARYELTYGGRTERQSSSGIIISTGAGSTGWLRSVMAGAAGLAAAYGDTSVPTVPPQGYDREGEQLFFSVREPFPSNITGVSLVHGVITRDRPLVVSSRQSKGGVIFSDGMEVDFVEFNSGTDVTIAIADQKAYLVVP
ncbi:hypothetical protein [Mesorhizobium loti]|uniref:hypothetical protein n=1 Tax=Rhizobium loti TaxID=381 RepID=UPI0003FC14AF|nr:hypothetical protein [Mesorhizobium loti]